MSMMQAVEDILYIKNKKTLNWIYAWADLEISKAKVFASAQNCFNLNYISHSQ